MSIHDNAKGILIDIGVLDPVLPFCDLLSLLHKFFNLGKSEAVHIIGSCFPVTLHDHHIADRQGMPGIPFRMPQVEPFIDSIQCLTFREPAAVNIVIIISLHGKIIVSQILGVHKPKIVIILSLFELIDGKAIFFSIQIKIFIGTANGIFQMLRLHCRVKPLHSFDIL